MVLLHDFHFELLITVVPMRSAADKFPVVFGPVIPIVPKRWMNEHEAFPAFHEGENSLLHFIIWDALVCAEIEHVDILEARREGTEVVRVFYACQAVPLERGGIGFV